MKYWQHDEMISRELKNKLFRRQQGVKRAKKLIKANPLWRFSFATLIKTRKPCSCYMCGNQRKHYGKTYQELKADLLLRETE